MAIEKSDAAAFLEWMCRHIVVLCGTYFRLDQDGKPDSDQKTYFFPGFIIDVLGQWCYVTAAHNVTLVLGEYVEKGWIRVNDDHAFMDYFGPDAKARMRIEFDYHKEHHLPPLEGRDLGLDIVLFPLRDYYRQHFEANGIQPFERKHWLGTYGHAFERYAVLGCPSAFVEPLDPHLAGITSVGSDVRMVLVEVTRLSEPPSTIDDPPDGHWFIGKANVPFSLKGISGGPIFGFERNKDGKWEYRLVALQSSWYEKEQVIYGCPISPVMTVIEDEIRLAQQEVDEEDTAEGDGDS